MKNTIALLGLLVVGLIAQAQNIVGIHLLNYNSDEDLLKLMDKVEGLSEKGINTIFLEVDYHFDFKSHPELIQTDHPITKSVAKKFADYCSQFGIKIVPQFQSLGHQSWAENTWKLLTVYPELDLTPGAFPNNDSIYCREWDVMNPKVNEIVFPLIEEIVDAFNSDGIHLGMDEVFLLGHNKSPSTKGMNSAFLYSKVVNEFHEYFTVKKGKQIYMWGDRLIDASKYGYGSWEASTNGTWPAIDSIPKDVIICDWHYNTQKEYPSIDLFLEKGFRVLPTSWKDDKAAEAFIRYSYAKQDSLMLGHLFSTWGAVPKEELLDYGSLNLGASTIKGSKFHEVFISQAGINEVGELLVNLAASNKSVEIRYTTDGTDPTVTSTLYSAPFVYKNGVEIKAAPFLKEEVVGVITSKYFTTHKAIGKNITMITTPSDKYAVEQREKLLVNGVDFTASFSDGEWLGFEGNDCELIIDMDSLTTLSKVSINFSNQVNNWIHHSNHVIILGSTDGKAFTQIGEQKKRRTGKPLVSFAINITGKHRYIKVIAKNQIIPAGFNGEGNPAWLFLDEIVIE